MMVLRAFENNTVRTLSLDGRKTLVGSSEECDFRIADDKVPGVAFRVWEEENGVRIDPVGLSDVRVNGKKARNALLSSGDRLEIGSVALIIDIGSEEGGGGEGATPETVLHDSLMQFVARVGQERDLDRLLHRLIHAVFSLIGGDEAFILKLDHEGKPQVLVSSSGDSNVQDRYSDTIVQEVLSTGEPVWVANALADPKFSSAQSIADLRLSSVVCCPIRVAASTIGIMYLGSKTPSVSFSNEDLASLSLYAVLAGMLINHVDFIVRQDTAIKTLTGTEDGIIGESPVVSDMMQRIASVSRSDITVVIQGETGTGKELVARAIHRRSPRSKGPFVPINCSSLRGELLESELFGHKKGAFTGAISDHGGLFVAAEGGTLFLDEIGEMEPQLQAKLLRTLESGMIRPVGASSESSVNVRILCATNRDLTEMVEKETFRSDLFYRINQFKIAVPPLRERGNDITLLAYYFLKRFRAQYPDSCVIDFTPSTLRAMGLYRWPGNIRELSSLVHRGVLSATGTQVELELGSSEPAALTFDEAVKKYQQKLIQNALATTQGSREAAARLLGMSRSSFFRHLSAMDAHE